MNNGVYGQSLGLPWFPEDEGVPLADFDFMAAYDPALYVPAISAPWVKGLFGTHRLQTLCCGMNIGVYDQVWGTLVPRNEGVPLADYDFMAAYDPALYVAAISAP